jgi:hypothetical protein
MKTINTQAEQQQKLSKVASYWEKTPKNSIEILDMRAVLK